MTYSITVEINSSEFDTNEGFYFLEMKDVFYKYNFSILTHTQEERLVFLATEFSTLNQNVIAFNACNNLEEILCLNKELKKYNLSLDTIYIPSNERVEQRKKKAYEEHIHWNRLLGASDEEIEKNFNDFNSILQEIKDGLSNTSINIVEC